MKFLKQFNHNFIFIVMTDNQKTVVDFTSLTNAYLEASNSQNYVKNFVKGLDEKLIRKISADKKEPKWLLEHRLKSLELFLSIPNPSCGPDISKLNLDGIRYYATADTKKNAKSWDEVDPEIKATFEKLKIPESERAFLAGVGTQYESEVVYHSLKEKWAKKGIIFLDLDVAVHEHEEIVKKYFMKCVPNTDHKYAALHGAVFSGGTFLYVPNGVILDEPLQAYFRMNSESMGQFEHTLIILEDDSEADYIEGCSAPKYGEDSLHAGCVEVYLAKNAKFRYSSVENWSTNTYNLNTKRAIVGENSRMQWVGGNLGSAVTMLYPASVLVGNNAQSDYLGIAVASKNQNQDTGAKVTILADNCRANIVAKSISKDSGVSTYRGIVDIKANAKNAVVNIECDALLFGNAVSDTIPKISVGNDSASVTHEASVGKISEEVLFFLETRGISEAKAKGMIVNGFLDEVVKTLPMEYSVELNHLIELEMEGSIG
ncbi:TPA: Fe-S cluster assembly protein SufB [Candidatus Peregrinibacteria bacterium]|nr:Fe-S cluster assembly protein SufB [Candidatus Peregrinibacteria bacterium]